MAAYPQSTKDTRNYINLTEVSETEVMNSSDAIFLMFSVDGVAAENNCIPISILYFLLNNLQYVGSTDTNNNVKYWRYQIFGGFCAVTIGILLLYSDLARQDDVSSELWSPTDFASELPVMKLISFELIKKIAFYTASGKTDFSASDT